MKIFVWTFLFFLTACSGSDHITEVGNPTTASTTNGTTSALAGSLSGLLGSVDGGVLVKGFIFSETDEEYVCELGEDEASLTCSCPHGGTITETFENGFSETGDSFTFNSDLVISFDACSSTACGEQVTLNGDVEGSISGEFDSLTGEGNITVVYGTDNECSGLTSNNSTVGFEITLTSDGTSEEFFGSFCIDDEIISFDSLEALEESVDPENTCEN